MNQNKFTRAAPRHYSRVLINAARVAYREIVAQRLIAVGRAAAAPGRA